MLIGTFVTGAGSTLDAVVGDVRAAREARLDSVYFPQMMGWDPLTLAALAGREVPDIGLGTAAVRTYAAHPLALAGQALTAQAATGGRRLTLGIGPSHRQVIEGAYGLSYERPARHVREYLEVLGPLLRGETVDYRGESLSASGALETPGAEPPSVLLAALGPVMLGMAGELADGTVTTWAGPELIGERIAPRVRESARAAGRPAPRVVAVALGAVTYRPDELRGEMATTFAAASGFASYRRVLDLQGLSGPQETVALGDEAAVADEIARFAAAGVTELVFGAIGDEHERKRTLDLLTELRTSAPDGGPARAS
ncbi:TIGR03564 family F420-dependent LLM class oxidoreductase [Streptomyces sp. 3MP-14]|uniref:TIGR03564 family F420-dependent LLM class oxidoreductase n=1 Tax=Streptomyces mimosae TaxID=2586635 RepID=A0A5N6A570_9ACTN|nr:MULTISPECIES: TIGR03564 family F420-dependent LLM class oxidoreductase [Streptomyces]KAB8163801.1 TIGR03564 family F420-dependent LLM class oxidoreductase [Streptomyces mimosae]KAB8175244.1 TIGR03564 family F420-dependent LLM class oxidoreductase [Streptomyces sp. 3MP-14]